MSGGDWKEMYSAAQSGDFDLLRYHISNGIDPNYQHPEILSTPLVASILADQTKIALYLLENGAQPDLRSEFDDMTPKQAAKLKKNKTILARLNENSDRIEISLLSKIRRFFKI